MKDTGVLIVQHGDFPFDFIEKEPETYRRVEEFLQRLSDASRELDHGPAADPHAADMERLATAVRAAGYDAEIGYLDFARPTLPDAVKTLAGRGHRRIVVANAPGLMLRSSHSLIDVPKALVAIRAAEPGLDLLYARPGGPMPLLARAIGKKISAAIGESFASVAPPTAARPGTAVVLVAHGDTPEGYAPDASLLREYGRDLARAEKLLVDWPRPGEIDPHQADSLVLAAALREMFWPRPVGIGYLEFARPTIGESFDRLTAAGARRVVVAGGTSFFSRSSHSLRDIPEAVEGLKRRQPDVEIIYAGPDLGLVERELARAIVFNIERALDGEVQPF